MCAYVINSEWIKSNILRTIQVVKLWKAKSTNSLMQWITVFHDFEL